MSSGILGPGAMGTRCGPSAAMLRGTLRGCRRSVATAGCTAVFPRQRNADQPLDVAQIAHLLGAGDQRDGDAVSAGTRGATDAVDIGLGHVGQVVIHDMADAVDVDAAG